MQRIEQIDDIARVLVDSGGRRIGLALIESAQVRREHAPVVRGKRELRLPHSGVQGKGMQENERPARPIALGRSFEIPELSDGRHRQIVGDQLSV